MLHMLRYIMGDTGFIDAAKTFGAAYADSNASPMILRLSWKQSTEALLPTFSTSGYIPLTGPSTPLLMKTSVARGVTKYVLF